MARRDPFDDSWNREAREEQNRYRRDKDYSPDPAKKAVEETPHENDSQVEKKEKP